MTDGGASAQFFLLLCTPLFLPSTTAARPVYGIEPETMVFEGSVFNQVNSLQSRPAQLAVNVLSPHVRLQDYDLQRRFDLVYSIEVAEHIPAQLHPAVVNFLVNR